MKQKKSLLIIDANALIHRAYHALPPLTTKRGELVNAVYGFLLVFLKTLRELKPDFIVAAFDLPFSTFRHRKFKDYKAKRPRTPEELSQQIPKVKEILKAFKVPVFDKEGFEADDIIATLKVKSQKLKVKSIIVSGDSDLLQLVDEQTKVYFLRRGIKNTVLYNEDLIKEKYQGLTPKQLVDFKALRGDPSDNIPGVKGIGEKTAIKLIKKFNSLENLYSNLTGLDKSLRQKLEEHREEAFLSKKLAQIRKDVPIDFDLKKCRWKDYNREKVIQVLKGLGFRSLITRATARGEDGRRNKFLLPSRLRLDERSLTNRLSDSKKPKQNNNIRKEKVDHQRKLF